ncbi:MAG: cysteine--tRNA ligase, partial [Cyanobacteria bacterium]|nr:cysteine--tRNA ligase [Cyanobacteriota bacterium]MDW8200706.1 DALR domain-containing protein [Cyanobacteriota bacterium SKYGB_h_bin112]
GRKQDPFDFVLWKGAKPGEPAWESPWGKGRPGWHIECSAMVRQTLGDRIDIHTGGADLVFPHHENEIAQSEAVTGVPLANYWLHNGMVNVGGEKMSKSLGNFTTIRQLLASGVDPMVLRLFILQAQYRKPIDFTDDAIASARHAWETLNEGLLLGINHGKALGWLDAEDPALMDPSAMHIDRNSDTVRRFQTAMDDDLNTPAALAVLFELAKDLRRQGNMIVHNGKPDANPQDLRQQWQTLVVLAEVLGLRASVPTIANNTGLTDAEVEALVQERRVARSAKNWAESDRIRDLLQAQGITLIDKPGGVTLWHR